MRRKDKERTEAAFLESVLREAETVCLALNTGAAPYALYVNFMYREGALFAHCATEGRKLDLLRADPRVGFTLATDVQVLPELFTTRYRSVSGWGTASIVDDPAERLGVFAGLAAKYRAACPDPVPEAMSRQIAVLRIAIEAMTGKESPGELSG
jgi:nitroimidazol reductase NimA-like FMN-containing flavoprotein (pyridoxamine 5'-phosphate oxidase superfamily)